MNNCPKVREAQNDKNKYPLICDCEVKLNKITGNLLRWYCTKDKIIRYFDIEKKRLLWSKEIHELKLEFTG